MPMNKYYLSKLLLAVFSLFILTALNQVSADQLNASVDRNKVSINESLTLTLRYTGNANASPDLRALNQDFEILTQNQSSQYRSFNGSIESYTDWIVTLLPLREGKLKIPAFSLAGNQSRPIEITVTPEQELPTGELRDVFLETILNKDESYVQEQLLITYRLYFSVNIEGLEQQELTLDNVLIEKLPDIKYRRNVDGKPYTVVEFSFALYPQTSGELTIPSLRWDARVSNSRRRDFYSFGSGRFEVKRLKTSEKSIKVKTQPEEFPGNSTWLPSTKVTIEENWSKNPDAIQAGEPLTRTITLTAEGLNSSQLPVISEDTGTANLKFYPEQPVKDDEHEASGVTGKRIEKYAVVVNKAGEQIIPAIRIPWWNVDENKLEYAEIPARKIRVTPGETSAEPEMKNILPPAQVDEEAASSSGSGENTLYWKALTLSSLLAALIFCILWLQTRSRLNRSVEDKIKDTNAKQRRQKLKESQAFNEIKIACEANDLKKSQDAIQQWLRVANIYQGSTIQFAASTQDSEIIAAFKQLDRAIYSSAENACDLKKLFHILERYRNQRQNSTTSQEDALPPLYQH